MSMLAYLVKTGELHFRGNLSRPPRLRREHDKSRIRAAFSPREQTRDHSSSDPGGVVGHAASAFCRVWLHTAWISKAGAWSRGFYQCVARHGRPNPFSVWLSVSEKVRMI